MILLLLILTFLIALCVGYYLMYYTFAFTGDLFNFIIFSFLILAFSFFTQRISFNLVCKAGFMVLNSSFCLSVKFLISPLNLKESVAGLHVLGCMFSLSSLWVLSYHSLLDCRVSAEKSVDSLALWEFP